jgi:hypothetical protein
VLFVGHGAVGTLLFCHYSGFAIDRAYDQPAGGGQYFAFVKNGRRVLHSWRRHPPLEATKRLVGTIVVVLSATLVFIPIPLSNVVPALVIALISLAYLEEDGVLLSIALLAAVIVLAVATAAVWQMVVGAKWITDLW